MCEPAMVEPQGGQTTPFALKYRLERELSPFVADNVRSLPRDRAGVYALWLPAEIGSDYECIYVGMSSICVRQRLLQHLQNETNPELARLFRLFPDIVMFSAAFTQGQQETADLETAVIQSWQPAANRAKRG